MNELDMIRLFLKDLDRPYTILQMSKIIRRSYTYTKDLARELISQGVLDKQLVGHSILCSLNRSSELSLGYLIMSSIKTRESFMRKRKDRDKIMQQIEQMKQKHPDAVLVYHNDRVKTAEKNLQGMIILYNYERYWRQML